MSDKLHQKQSLLDKYVRKTQVESKQVTDGVESHTTETHSVLEQPVAVAMLDLVFADGAQVALPYHHLERAAMVGAQTIELRFVHEHVTITGRQLDDLFKGILGHRVRRIVVDARYEFSHGDLDSGQASIATIHISERERQ